MIVADWLIGIIALVAIAVAWRLRATSESMPKESFRLIVSGGLLLGLVALGSLCDDLGYFSEILVLNQPIGFLLVCWIVSGFALAISAVGIMRWREASFNRSYQRSTEFVENLTTQTNRSDNPGTKVESLVYASELLKRSECTVESILQEIPVEYEASGLPIKLLSAFVRHTDSRSASLYILRGGLAVERLSATSDKRTSIERVLVPQQIESHVDEVATNSKGILKKLSDTDSTELYLPIRFGTTLVAVLKVVFTYSSDQERLIRLVSRRFDSTLALSILVAQSEREAVRANNIELPLPALRWRLQNEKRAQLRSMLSSIIGSVELLQSDRRALDADSGKLIEIIDRSAKRMTSAIS